MTCRVLETSRTRESLLAAGSSAPGRRVTRLNRCATLRPTVSHLSSALPPVHRRQFVVARQACLVQPDWTSFPLAGGLVLSACPETRVIQVSDADSQCWTLIGHAFQADPRLPGPIDQIASSRSGTIPGATYSWAGRWLLVGPDVVVCDAGALLGLFYLSPEVGAFLASSSLAVLKRLVPELEAETRRLHWHGVSWFIPPSSKLKGVRKLLPDQTLSLRTRRVTHLRRAFPERFTGLTTDERARTVTSHLGNVLIEMTRKNSDMSIALTGGIDSRSTLAVAVANGLAPAVVTMQHARITKADSTIPPIICRELGLRHTYLRPGRADPRRYALYDAHTLGNTADADRDFFAQGIFDRLDEGEWLVRSAPWSMGKNYYYDYFHGLSWEQLRKRPQAILLRHKTFGSLKRSAQCLAEWIAWRDSHAEPYDWRDLWYRDQRMGGLVSSLEQSLDLAGCVSVHAVNCGLLCDIMLSEPELARGERRLQKRILALSGTGLERFAINPVLESGLTIAARKTRKHVGNVVLETANLMRTVRAAGQRPSRSRMSR